MKMFLKLAMFLQIVITVVMLMFVGIAYVIGDTSILENAIEVYLQASVICFLCLIVSIPLRKIAQKIFDI